jgi:hypothetical protein
MRQHSFWDSCDGGYSNRIRLVAREQQLWHLAEAVLAAPLLAFKAD